MTFGTLIRRSLRFHWRAHLGVVLGAAVGSAALIGALVVGDSVKGSLKNQALKRLAGASVVLNSGDRFFQADLLDRMKEAGSRQIFGGNSKPGTPTNIWGQYTGTFRSRTLLKLPATVSRSDMEGRANHVQLMGLSYAELQLLPHDREGLRTGNPGQAPIMSGVWINAALARQLTVKPGDSLLFRIQKPSVLSRDVSISTRGDAVVALRLQVEGIAKSPLADFNPTTGGRPPLNAFISRTTLEAAVHMNNRANVLLLDSAMTLHRLNRWERFNQQNHMYWLLRDRNNINMPRPFTIASPFKNFDWWKNTNSFHSILNDSVESVSVISPFLREVLTLQDLQQDLVMHAVATPKDHPPESSIELRTPRIFVDPPIVQAALAADTNAQPVLTYLVNLIQAGTNATPYSMVTAADTPWTPPGLKDDEIVVNQWLADDLQVKPGDSIALSYFDPESGVHLRQQTNAFRVRSIVPMAMPWADRTLMPDFPGIEKAESTRDWDAGFPLTYKVRSKDDDYWKEHRGTPKAFITLAAGQKMWGNRFGNLTAIRFPIPTNGSPALTPTRSPGKRENRPPASGGFKTSESSTVSEKSKSGQQLSPLPGGAGQGEGERQTNFVEAYRAALEKKILANLKPEELGLRFEPVREQALKAAEQSQDFGGLFLGFSFFVIGAALLLMGLLSSLGLEQRAPEIGTLLALGFTPKQVRKLLLREAVALSFVGGLVGVIGGIYYAKGMLHGLATFWRDAVGATTLNFHVTGPTLVTGVFASVVVSVVTIWLTLRKFVRRPARELLAGETQDATPKGRSRGNLIGAAALVCAVGTVGWTLWSGATNNAESFFSAGSLVLVAGIAFVSAWLARRTGVAPASNFYSSSDRDRRNACPTLASLAVRGCARRRKRSLSTVAMLACGSFLIVSIGVFRLDANHDATKRRSGTGGFALIGQTTMPVVQDLNSPSGRDFFALNENDLKGVSFVPFRVREGDEASCLNLNAAPKPRLLGAKPESLAGRFAFAKGGGWKSLISTGLKPGANEIEIPALGDANSIQWAMHKKVGDTIDYVDERGQPFKVRIVGAVANSILQGQLIIDEAEFVKRFPGESGYRMFLIDAPSNAVSQVSATLSRALQDVGLELTPAAQRLAQFNAVQNTYLGTFQVLGGLGLLLGSVGLGIVVLRNVLERRGELAVLMAVGFRKATLQRLLWMENGALLAAGLLLGVIAAAVAVLPALLSPGAQLPYASITLTLGAVLVNGALWTWAATRFAVRGDLLKALRNE